MRAFFIRLAILLSVIMAGIHVPATAAERGESCDNATVISLGAQLAGHSHDHSAPVEQGSDTAHHHHYPMALHLIGTAGSGDLAPVAQLHFPVAPDALTSRTIAPPIDPPLA